MPGMMWLEVDVVVPVAARDAVVEWFLEHGAAGVREDWQGLWDGDGPIVSGDPADWAGDAPPNRTGQVVLVGWVDAVTPREALLADLAGALGRAEALAPGAANAKVEVWEVPDRDWNAVWKSSWQPAPVGRNLLVCPSWLGPPEDAAGRVVLRIDPGMAFGTGTHFTTSSCLEFLEEILPSRPAGEPTRLLDVGTGSGILAVAGLKLGAAEAGGVDVDLDAVAEAIGNAAVNDVGDRFRAFQAPFPPGLGFFHVAFANILAETVVDLSPAIAALLLPGGDLVVSGVLHERDDSVQVALSGLGLSRVGERRDQRWVTSRWRMGSRG